MQTLEFIEITTKSTPTACMIWLHGLGADGHDFVDIVPELNLPSNLGIRFIFPHAPVQPVTLNAGHPMRAWFDIFGLDEFSAQDDAGIRKSQQTINHLIEKIARSGIPKEKIILAGFSQGGALALHCGLRYKHKLAGIIGLSTFLPLADKLKTEKSIANSNTPIFLAHGIQDFIVPLRFGELSRNTLVELGYKITWNAYEMPHSVCPQEIKDIGYWINTVLNSDMH